MRTLITISKSYNTSWKFFCFLWMFFILLIPGVNSRAQADQSILQFNALQPPSMTFSVLALNVPIEKGIEGRLVIAASVPVNHHAYLDKGKEGFFIPIEFNFAKVESSGYRVLNLTRPEGEFENEVQATVLRGNGEFVFSLNKTNEMKDGIIPPVAIKFQICDDITKVCFPPKIIDLFLTTDQPDSSPVKIENASLPSAPIEEELTDKINTLFEKYSQNLLVALLLIFVAGLLSAATPCVYPMLPITSAILMARGGSDKRMGWYHSAVYFFGIVFTYVLLGYIAGMTGGAVNVIMRSSVVNLTLSLFFGFFGLSMLGIVEFPSFEGATARLSISMEKRSDMIGTFFMGMTAGLIVSPCVGPVVFTILIQVTDQVAQANALAAAETGASLSFIKKSIIASRGGVLMGGFGFGIGIPFLFVGLFSNRMPRSGAWMDYVKYLLGLAILYIAWIYYFKGVKTYGIQDDGAYIILLGLCAIFVSYYLGLFRTEKSPVKKGLSIILFASSVFFIHNGSNRVELIGKIEKTGEVVPDNMNTMERHGNLEWHRNFDNAKDEAIKKGKPVFVDFFANWCANCVEFGKLSLKDQKLNESLKKAVLLKIYDTDPIFEVFKEDPNHRELKIGLPYFCILKPNGELFWKGTRYDAVDTFSSMIDSATQSLSQ